MIFRVGQQSGGGGSLGTAAQAAPAHPGYTVGAGGFGPAPEDDDDGWVQLTEKGRKMVADSMAASIVRLECEADELRAEVALLLEERAIIQTKLEGFTALAEALAKTQVELKAERDEARKLAESAMFEADCLRGQLHKEAI